MTWEEYVAKYGYDVNPKTPEQQKDWDSLGSWGKEHVKKERPMYEGPGPKEQEAARQWWEKYQAGPQTNIWQGLSEMLGYKPRDIKRFAMGKFGELMERPDFAKEYGLAEEELGRKFAEQFAGRGLLDSSAHAAAMGGGLTNLMLQRAAMEEGAWQNRMGLAGGFLGQGMTFADFLNTQYLQDLGLGAQAVGYLGGERAQRNQFNLARGGFPWNPVTSTDVFGGIAQLGAQFAPMPFDFGFNTDFNIDDMQGGGGASSGF